VSDHVRRKPGLVAWDTLCLSKKEGGMGVRDVMEWAALVAKQIWNIASKPGRLWIKWVNNYYLKGHTIWSCKQSAKESRCWKQIPKVKDLIQHGFCPKSGTWLLQSTASMYSVTSGYQ